jgi:hypothetical protein
MVRSQHLEREFVDVCSAETDLFITQFVLGRCVGKIVMAANYLLREK